MTRCKRDPVYDKNSMTESFCMVKWLQVFFFTKTITFFAVHTNQNGQEPLEEKEMFSMWKLMKRDMVDSRQQLQHPMKIPQIMRMTRTGKVKRKAKKASRSV